MIFFRRMTIPPVFSKPPRVKGTKVKRIRTERTNILSVLRWRLMYLTGFLKRRQLNLLLDSAIIYGPV